MPREFDAFPIYPPAKRVANRTIHNRIAASYRDHEFYDGDRMNGYGGMKNDGRWKAVADNLVKVYGLNEDSNILQIGCHKGFLLAEFMDLGMSARGTEVSEYAISQAPEEVRPFIKCATPFDLPFGNNNFDLVLAVSPVYALTLTDSIQCLREINRVGRGKAFITLGSYETYEELKLMHRWAILGNLFLTHEEWKTVMAHTGYEGDYRLETVASLGLVES